jgi:tripeptide aminopeptidase
MLSNEADVKKQRKKKDGRQKMTTREKEIAEKFIELAAIDGISFEERHVADYLIKAFGELGVKLSEDDTAIAIGGNTGNLYAFIEGEGEKKYCDPILFCAHMDTVSPGKNKKILLADDGLITSDGSTVLGADDRAAIAAMLEAVRMIKKYNLTHPPIELLFTPAEELYTVGAAEFDYTKIRSKAVFIPDCSGEYGVFSSTEPSLIYFEIEVNGRSAHAGFEPEKGINAIEAAALAISRIRQGWISEKTSLNIGSISGGTVSNAVPSKVLLKGEIRSLEHDEAVRALKDMRDVFEKEAARLGASVFVREDIRLMAYSKESGQKDSFQWESVKRYEKALLQQNRKPVPKRSFGGSDANVLIRKGFDALCIFCPMHDIHTVGEYTTAAELTQFTDLILNLMTEA